MSNAPLSNLGHLIVDSSVLARLAERAQVDLRVARKALKRLADASEGERRFMIALARLGAEDLHELMESVETSAPIPLARALPKASGR